MKNKHKILLALGTAATMAAPIAAVVSCTAASEEKDGGIRSWYVRPHDALLSLGITPQFHTRRDLGTVHNILSEGYLVPFGGEQTKKATHNADKEYYHNLNLGLDISTSTDGLETYLKDTSRHVHFNQNDVYGSVVYNKLTPTAGDDNTNPNAYDIFTQGVDTQELNWEHHSVKSTAAISAYKSGEVVSASDVKLIKANSVLLSAAKDALGNPASDGTIKASVDIAAKTIPTTKSVDGEEMAIAKRIDGLLGVKTYEEREKTVEAAWDTRYAKLQSDAKRASKDESVILVRGDLDPTLSWTGIIPKSQLVELYGLDGINFPTLDKNNAENEIEYGLSGTSAYVIKGIGTDRAAHGNANRENIKKAFDGKVDKIIYLETPNAHLNDEAKAKVRQDLSSMLKKPINTDNILMRKYDDWFLPFRGAAIGANVAMDNIEKDLLGTKGYDDQSWKSLFPSDNLQTIYLPNK